MAKELAIKVTVDTKAATIAFSGWTTYALKNAKAISAEIMRQFSAAVPGFGGAVQNPNMAAFKEVSAGATTAAKALEKAAKAMQDAAIEVKNARGAGSPTSTIINDAAEILASKKEKRKKHGSLSPDKGKYVDDIEETPTMSGGSPTNTIFKESVALFGLAVKTFSASVGEGKYMGAPSGETYKETAKVKKAAAAAAKEASKEEVKDTEKILSLTKQIAVIKPYTGEGAKKMSQTLERLMGEGKWSEGKGGEEQGKNPFAFEASIKKLARLHTKIENALIEVEKASAMLSATAVPPDIKKAMEKVIADARKALESMIPTVSAVKSLQAQKAIRGTSAITGIDASTISEINTTVLDKKTEQYKKLTAGQIVGIGKLFNALVANTENAEDLSKKHVKGLQHFAEIFPPLAKRLGELGVDLVKKYRQTQNLAGIEGVEGVFSPLGQRVSLNMKRGFERNTLNADRAFDMPSGTAAGWTQRQAIETNKEINEQIALVKKLQKEWGLTTQEINASGLSASLFNRKQSELVSLLATAKANKQAYNAELTKENKLQSEYNVVADRIAKLISTKEGKYHTADDVKTMRLSIQALKEWEHEYRMASKTAKDPGMSEAEKERQRGIKISTQLIKDMDVAYKMAIKDGIDFQKVIMDARAGTIHKGGSNVDMADVSRYVKKYDQLAVTHPDLAEGVQKHFWAEYRMDIEKTHTVLSGFYATVKKYAAFQLSFYSGMALIFAAFNTIKSFVTAGMEFTQTMKDIQAVTGESARGIEIVANAAQRVSRETPLAAKEIANMGLQFIRAGLDAQQASVAMDIAARVATISGEDSKTVVDTLATSIMAWKKESSEIPQLGNAIAAALNYSRLTVTDLGTAFNFVGGIMSALKVPFNETMGVLASLSNMGVRASTMATGMTAFLSGFIAPSHKLGSILKDLQANMEKLDPTKIQGPNKFATILKELNRIGFSTAEAFGTLETRAARFYEFLSAVGPKALIDMENKIAASTQLEEGVKTAMEGPVKAMRAAWNSMSITAIVVLQSIVPFIVLVANALNVMGGVVAHVLHLFTLWPALIGFAVGALFLLQKEIVALNVAFALAGKTGIFASVIKFFSVFITMAPMVVAGERSIAVAAYAMWEAINPLSGVLKILLAIGVAWGIDKLLFGDSKAGKDLKGFAAAATESQESLDKYKKDFKMWNDDMEGEVSKTDPIFNRLLEIFKKIKTPADARKEHELSIIMKEIKSYSITVSDAAKNAGISMEEMEKILKKTGIAYKDNLVNANELAGGLNRQQLAVGSLSDEYSKLTHQPVYGFFDHIGQIISEGIDLLDKYIKKFTEFATLKDSPDFHAEDVTKSIYKNNRIDMTAFSSFYAQLPEDARSMLKRQNKPGIMMPGGEAEGKMLDEMGKKPHSANLVEIYYALRGENIPLTVYTDTDIMLAKTRKLTDEIKALTGTFDFISAKSVANRRKAVENTLSKLPGMPVETLKQTLAIFDSYIKDYKEKVELYKQDSAKNPMPSSVDLEKKIQGLQTGAARHFTGTGESKFSVDFEKLREELKIFELEQQHAIELRNAKLTAEEHLMKNDFSHQKTMFEEHFKGIDALYKKDLVSTDAYYGYKRDLMKNLSNLEVANINDIWTKETIALTANQDDLIVKLGENYKTITKAETKLAGERSWMGKPEITGAETRIEGLRKDVEQILHQLDLNSVASISADNKKVSGLKANVDKDAVDAINLARDESLAKLEQEARWEEKKYKMAIDTLTAKKDEAKLQGWGEAYAKAKEDLWKKEREHAIFKLENEIKTYELVIAQAAITGSGFKHGDAKYAEEHIAELRKQIADKPTKYTEETFGSAAKRAIDEYLSKVEDMPKAFGKAVSGAMQDMQNAFSSFFDVNSANFMKFGKLAVSVLNSIQKKLADMVAEQLMGSSGIGGLLKWLFPTSTPTSLPGVTPDYLGINPSTPSPLAQLGPVYQHSGGMIFHEGGLVPPLSGIRKYHTGGLAADERPAILQSGEYVVSRRGVKALDNINNGNVAQPNVNVSVNVTNQSSAPVSATAGQAQFNGRDYVVGVILKDIASNGPLRALTARG